MSRELPDRAVLPQRGIERVGRARRAGRQGGVDHRPEIGWDRRFVHGDVGERGQLGQCRPALGRARRPERRRVRNEFQPRGRSLRVEDLEREYKTKIIAKADPSLHLEQYDLIVM